MTAFTVRQKVLTKQARGTERLKGKMLSRRHPSGLKPKKPMIAAKLPIKKNRAKERQSSLDL